MPTGWQKGFKASVNANNRAYEQYRKEKVASMATLQEQVQAIDPERGYHIHGLVWLAYGHNFEEVTRQVDVSLCDADAALLNKAESERAIAEMIANVYNDLDIDEQEPNFAICHLDKWDVVIEPSN